MRLRKSEILRGRKRFQEIFTEGKRLAGRTVVCYCTVTPLNRESAGKVYAGFTAQGTSLKAVQRNRLKRLLREAYRQSKHLLEEKIPQGTQLSLICSVKKRQGALPTYHTIVKDLETLLMQITSCAQGKSSV